MTSQLLLGEAPPQRIVSSGYATQTVAGWLYDMSYFQRAPEPHELKNTACGVCCSCLKGAECKYPCEPNTYLTWWRKMNRQMGRIIERNSRAISPIPMPPPPQKHEGKPTKQKNTQCCWFCNTQKRPNDLWSFECNSCANTPLARKAVR